MIGSLLVTIGLALDIVGVALLLAGPRVHHRPSFLALEQPEDPDHLPTLRRWWSTLGPLGLPIVCSGFALQMLGAWSQYLAPHELGLAIGITVPVVFLTAWLLIRELPHRD